MASVVEIAKKTQVAAIVKEDSVKGRMGLTEKIVAAEFEVVETSRPTASVKSAAGALEDSSCWTPAPRLT